MFVSKRIEEDIIKATSEKLEVDINLVGAISKFQWKSIVEGFHKYKKMEIGDIGRIEAKDFTIEYNLQKRQKQLKWLEEDAIYRYCAGRIETRRKQILDDIEFLKTKL